MLTVVSPTTSDRSLKMNFKRTLFSRLFLTSAIWWKLWWRLVFLLCLSCKCGANEVDHLIYKVTVQHKSYPVTHKTRSRSLFLVFGGLEKPPFCVSTEHVTQTIESPRRLFLSSGVWFCLSESSKMGLCDLWVSVFVWRGGGAVILELWVGRS